MTFSKNEILYVRPRVVVPMGELVCNYIALQKGLSKVRGSVLRLHTDFQESVGSSFDRVVPTPIQDD